jgi:nitrogen fixation NifU-like protein
VTQSSLNDLYQDIILEHSKNPRNSGNIENPTHIAKGNNPLCGDRLTIFLKLNAGLIEDIKFEARGCAISVASASMMSMVIRGKTVEDAAVFFSKFNQLIVGNQTEDDGLQELVALAGVREFPTRIKCATLPWHALQEALKGGSKEVRTE